MADHGDTEYEKLIPTKESSLLALGRPSLFGFSQMRYSQNYRVQCRIMKMELN